MTDGKTIAFGRRAVRPGLKDPVFDSQRVFRAALSALAEPARAERAPFSECFGESPPGPPVLLALALTLLDARTGFRLSPSLKGLLPYLSFHTGARERGVGEADFVLAAFPGELPGLESLSLGTETRPDKSATVIVGLSGKGGGSFEARGPGIEGRRVIRDIGLPLSLHEERQALVPLFPQGVDFILCLADSLVGLPRTTALSPLETEGPS